MAFECKVVIINPDVNENKVCYILNRYLVMYIFKNITAGVSNEEYFMVSRSDIFSQISTSNSF